MRETHRYLCRVFVSASFCLAACAAEDPGKQRPLRRHDTATAPQARGAVAQELERTALIKRDIVYGSEVPQSQNLDLYVPRKASEPLPLVVWIHGGGFVRGSKRPTVAMPLLDRGFAVASIEYRFLDVAPFPAQIHDCKAAIRWLRAHAREHNIDPERIGVWGSSAGAHLAALLGTTNGNQELEGTVGTCTTVSSSVQAVCDWYGSSDMLTMPRVRQPFGDEETKAEPLLGGPLPERRELAKLVSPFHHAEQKTVPFLIMHGDADRTVPLEQSTRLHERLKAAGTDSTLMILKGQGHGFKRPVRPVEEFFERTLREDRRER